MILCDFRAPSVNSFNRKRRHIGIRIIIRIIYYPINGYPDSKLSVLSMPNNRMFNDNHISKYQEDHLYHAQGLINSSKMPYHCNDFQRAIKSFTVQQQ